MNSASQCSPSKIQTPSHGLKDLAGSARLLSNSFHAIPPIPTPMFQPHGLSFLKHTNLIPSSGPLHLLLFPLPGSLFVLVFPMDGWILLILKSRLKVIFSKKPSLNLI